MRYLICLILLCCNSLYAQYRFPELDRAIGSATQYDQVKENKIARIKKTITNVSGGALFDQYVQLFEEYKVFNYDSAYHYAQLQLDLALQLHQPQWVNDVRIRFGFMLVSAGLFKEALDSLQKMKPEELPNASRLNYYTLLARCYYDLADYTMDSYHSPGYNIQGNRYLDSALVYQTSPFDIAYYTGLKYIRARSIDTAKLYLEKLIHNPDLSLHQQALATSTMSDIYIQKGHTDSAIILLVRAAIADIKSSTKETSAIFHLSNILFQKGDLKNASTYIEKAVKDAVSYGARQRKMQMSAILPLIEGEKVARVEHEKRTLTTYAIIVTLLLMLLGYLVYLVTKQVRKLKIAQKALTKAHTEQQEMNLRLEEANKIKEEYIGFFFNAHTAFYEKMERFARKAEQKIAAQKPEELAFLVRHLDIKQERAELLKNFDTIFLRIFPHFIECYNQLFDPDDQTPAKESEVLNTDQRIFALYRLGIHDNDKIASILGYSVNTINTYKTRVKNKSHVPNDLFEEKIMEIKSIS